NGETYPELLTLSQIKNDQGDVLYYVGIFTDISDIKQSQEKLKHLAHHDPLTDLPNRLLITDRIQQTIKQGKRNGNQFAIMFIDLDFFKGINDTYGHTTGDKLLRQVSHRIQRLIRDEDTLARLGGDEFVLLQENVHQASDTMTMAKKIIKSFKSPFKIYEIELRISTSIGICLYPNDGKTAENLLKNADTAMYLAKDEGRNNFQFYTKSLTKKAKENLRMENEMRKALENGDFMVHYQPQVNMKTGQLTGFEALSRWHHGEWGAVSPVKFIPAAERCGLINALGESMLLMACRQGKEWLDRGYEFGRISVNISGAQLKNGNLVKAIKDTLVETGFPSRHLELEVTESCVMDQFESAIEQLKAIRKLGVTISIDDFGTGHSSLSYLKMMPVSKLKIDRSFIKDIPADQDDIAITQTIIAMSNALKLETIAEGIETQEQVDFLLSNGCMLAQGYYYSRPEEAEKIEKKYWTGKKAKLKVV
ncbi:MAG: EAL domain-containing protein, partial [Deltaproteobacteria bacterium]|nr:EAL domain-containing protein [Deltaproteobacteria bacterium]